MTLSDLSIRRPILTWMMTLALIVFGVLGYQRLGVDQYPNMEFPILTVTAVLEGATPQGIEEDVTDVLEEQLNTIAGVRSLRSTSYPGASLISVEFELDVDLDIAAQDVRDRIARAGFLLPPEIEPPTVSKFNSNSFPVLWTTIRTERPLVETSEYVKRNINPALETIPGVAAIMNFGAQERNIRIWLDGDALRARELSATDVISALRREHVELPGGQIEAGRVEFSVKTFAEFRTLEALEGLVIRHIDGAPILLRDVARVEDGSEDATVISHFNGESTVGIGILKQSGSNTVTTVDRVYERLELIRESLPSGIELYGSEYWLDFSLGVREAVDETEFALAFGALLAVLTVFVFLRRSRPTLIVAAAIPISLLATFGLVWLAGYTLNTMTLLGMTLAVGVVIDDAIVVLENIERHREAGKNAREAAETGTREIAFAATSATIAVAAVFLPVVFVEGLVGNFLGEFGLTVAGSVLISLFVALTLTPMLAARMPPPKERAHGSIYHRLEQGLTALETAYRRVLDLTLRHRAVTIVAALSSFGLAGLMASQLDREFFPRSDTGMFYAVIEAPPGTSVQGTLGYVENDVKWFLAQPEVRAIMSAAGSTGGGAQATRRPTDGLLFGTLAPRAERDRSVFEIMDEARKALGQVPGRKIRVIDMSSMSTGARGSFQMDLRGNRPLAELDSLADQMVAALGQAGGFVDLDKSLELGLPEVRVVPDRRKAAALGVDARTIAEAIQVMIGGMDVGVFKEAGRRFDIRMRLEAEDRQSPEAIGNLYVRGRDGNVVALRNLVSLETGAAPSAITRVDRNRSVTIEANLEGIVLGEAVATAREIGARILPEGVTLEPGGDARALEESGRQFGIALGLGVLVIFMVLAAQFESLVHPLTVMLALPLAMVGALGGLLLFGQTLNMFSMIGILLLFGLVTKNSILLVDYANQLRSEGMNRLDAIRHAAPARMRPVLMTALSMIFGVLPAAIGLGPGAESRRPMAVATAAGMLSSTVLTLMVVPVFYLLFDDAADWVKRGFSRVFGGGGEEVDATSAES
ncbi:MAG: efflux RND transporter permease subunit [Deltaproteobacteria bacterium]|nr:efflux RND transporter permease subunit [Deltaproteobacteria bacterium]